MALLNSDIVARPSVNEIRRLRSLRIGRSPSESMSVMAVVSPTINLASIPCDAVTPAESRAMLHYNGSRVHNAKYELVGTCQCDWAFRLFFVLVQERPRSIVAHRGGKRQWVSTR